MGVDTVKLSYRGCDFTWPLMRHLDESMGWGFTGKHGSVGPVRWAEYRHEDGTTLRTKGIAGDPVVLWEGSLPKYLGVCGAAEAALVRVLDRHLRSLLGPAGRVPAPTIRRLDLTHDELDPDGLLLDAAVGWNPHARSRYVQADYLNPADGGRTVWQHNKTRGVRVYDKCAESGQEWARDVTRIEYQVRGSWLEKYGLDRIYEDLPDLCDRVLSPVVSDLRSRAGMSEAARGAAPAASGPGEGPERIIAPLM